VGRLQAYLYSRKNIAGCLLALGGLALHFTGLIVGLEWLPITAGLYLIGALLMPGERALDLRLDASAAADDKAIREALDRLVKSIQGRVPADILLRVEHIRDSILVTLGNDDGNGGNGNGGNGNRTAVDHNVYMIRQTALSYLPEALNAFLALPRMYANRSLGGRRSPHDSLLAQLDLMDQKMSEVAEAVVAHDADRLEAHGRFLAEKFGGSTFDLDADTGSGGEATAPAQQEARAAAQQTTTATVQEAVAERDRVRG
jgi:hypothetical protein